MKSRMVPYMILSCFCQHSQLCLSQRRKQWQRRWSCDERLNREPTTRPVWQRNVRSETTQDKAGSLPPAVYSQPEQKNIPLSSLIESKQLLTTHQRLLFPPGIDELQAVSLTFVKGLYVMLLLFHQKTQFFWYQFNVQNDGMVLLFIKRLNFESQEEGDCELVSKTCMTGHWKISTCLVLQDRCGRGYIWSLGFTTKSFFFFIYLSNESRVLQLFYKLLNIFLSS